MRWSWRASQTRWWLLNRIYHPVMESYNRLQGCRFFWVEDPGSPAGGYMDMTEKCCPYPLRFDWSVRACVKAGDCGCVKGQSAALVQSKEKS